MKEILVILFFILIYLFGHFTGKFIRLFLFKGYRGEELKMALFKTEPGVERTNIFVGIFYVLVLIGLFALFTGEMPTILLPEFLLEK